MKKEELIKELAVAKRINQEYSFDEENRRKEFAKAFGWYESGYGDRMAKTPSWEQIFVRVGMLIARKDNLETNSQAIEAIKTLEMQVGNLLEKNQKNA